MINKYKDLVIDHYNNYEEDERFNRKCGIFHNHALYRKIFKEGYEDT